MTLRVLVLEDNPADAELLTREVGRAVPDPTIRVVATREEFLAALQPFAPDLVLSDHSLAGGFTGRDALAIVRAANPDLPFVLLTGSLDEETAVEYMRLGASDYLLKDRIARLGPAVRSAVERARQGRALRRGMELLRQVVDTAPSFVFVRDREGRFVLANRALAGYCGTTVNDLLGKNDAELGPRASEIALLLADDQQVLAGEKVPPREEAVTDPRTGERRWLHLVKAPILLPGEPHPLVLGLVTDVTERRLMEEQYYQAQKMEAIGQLAGGVAHDFNNLLTVILGHADLLLATLPPGGPHAASAQELRDAASRGAALTRQLLAFSRKQVLDVRPLDLNALATEIEKLLRRLLGENILLELRLGPDLGTVVADRSQLEQVILNLAVNARDAMPAGGRITIETARVDLSDEYTASHLGVAPGPYVMLAVTDAGIGMDEATRRHLFEPFFTTKEPGKGTGLGLATVYGIVRQAGGTIWVYSAPGRGTTFKIYLPRTSEPVAPGPEIEDAAVARGTETILLAEDADPVRRLARQLLESFGYTVLEARNGEEALHIAGTHTGAIDLLITDVVMPGLPGPELAGRLTEALPGLRVLFISGYTGDSTAPHQAGAEDATFLQKPFTASSLARRVREMLDAEPGGDG